VWVMLPAGSVTDSTIERLGTVLNSGDIIIDGGNTYFKDDVRRASQLKLKGIGYVDVGTSGGIWGFENGYSLMIGGEKSAFESIEPIFRTLAPGSKTSNPPVVPTPHRINGKTADLGYLHCGPVGAGHFVKMVHNGIEYGLMQAMAEGFDILKNADSLDLPEEHRFKLDLTEISEVWRRGSIVSSWLLDLAAMSLNSDPELSQFEGFVKDSGEGRWTLQAAIEESVSAEVLAASLFTRFRSRKSHTFAEKILSAMRFQFGGHTEKANQKAS